MACPHPGKILLQQYLEPQKISQNRLARAIQVPPRRINEIIHAKRAISADTAIRLAIYFGGNAGDWMQLQAAFDIEKIRQRVSTQLKMIPPAARKPAATHPRPESKPVACKPASSLKKRIMR